MRTTALLLAAGESARMGTPKALLEWGGRPLLGHQLAVLQRSRVDECIVVLGREAGRLGGLVQPLLRPGWKARAVVNPRPADGKSSASRVVVCGTKYGFIGLPATTTQGVQSVGLRAAPGSGDVVDTPAGATTYLEPAALVATLVDEGDESAPAGSTPPTPAARGGF